MNIVFLTTTLMRFAGDNQSSFVFEQARAWKQARPADSVHIIAPDDSAAKREEVIDGVVIHRYRYFMPRTLQKLPYPAILPNIRHNPLLLLQLPFMIAGACMAVIKLNRQLPLDLLYAHWVVPNGFIAWLVNLVTKLQGTELPYVIHNHSSDLRQLLRIPFFGRRLARAIIRTAGVFFCVNGLLHDEALALFAGKEQRLIAKKTVVLPMGVNYSGPRVAGLPAGEAGRESRVKYDLGFIGRLTKKKGVAELLDALQELPVPVALAIAGSGEEEKHLKTMAKTKPAKNSELRVEFLGHLENAEKTRFFRQCRAVVVPSLSTGDDIEGIPVTLLEALLYGKIVIASDATNVRMLPEWQEIKSAVFWVADVTDTKELAGALKSVLELPNREIVKRVGAVQRYVSRYAWQNLIHEYFLQLKVEG